MTFTEPDAGYLPLIRKKILSGRQIVLNWGFPLPLSNTGSLTDTIGSDSDGQQPLRTDTWQRNPYSLLGSDPVTGAGTVMQQSILMEKGSQCLVIYDETKSGSTVYRKLIAAPEDKADAKERKAAEPDGMQWKESGLGQAYLSAGEDEKNVLGVSVAAGQQGEISKTLRFLQAPPITTNTR